MFEDSNPTFQNTVLFASDIGVGGDVHVTGSVYSGDGSFYTAGWLQTVDRADPATPPANQGRFYSRAGRPYFKSDAGNVFDLAITGSSGGGGGAGGLGVLIKDEGVALGTGTTIDFVGAGVTAEMLGNEATVTIPGGGGGATVVSTGTFNVEEVLYEETLGSITGSLVLSPVPQGYDHLKILLRGRSDAAVVAEWVRIYFNGDTTQANYRYGQDAGGTSQGAAAGDLSRIGVLVGASGPAGAPGLNMIDIPDYTVTGTHAAALTLLGERESSTSIFVRMNHLQWEQYAAINQIRLSPESGDFDVGTHVQIVGVGQRVLVTSVE